jgi:hypothetical protein
LWRVRVSDEGLRSYGKLLRRGISNGKGCQMQGKQKVKGEGGKGRMESFPWWCARSGQTITA